MARKVKMEEFLAKIDFAELKKQKSTLLKVIDLKSKASRDLTGIMNLIDTIQDIAVDQYGYKEKEVFKLNKK